MTSFTFKPAEIKLPDGKYIIIIRDKQMHHTWGTAGNVFNIFGPYSVPLEDFKPTHTDIIYACPTPETYYEYISKGKCLDGFRLVTGSDNDKKTDQIIEYIKSHPTHFIGRNDRGTKRHIIISKDETKRLELIGEDGKTRGLCSCFDMPYYIFESPYEFFKWLNS